MTLVEKNKEIEERILSLDTDDSEFAPIADGLIDPEKYESSKIRIMWILKEAYAQPNDNDYGGWSMSQAYRDKPTWELSDKSNRLRKMIYVSHGIENDFLKWNDMSYIHEDKSMFSVIMQIAYINLKKIPGGTISNDHEIGEHFQKNKGIILEQIESFKPEIIIGGNTMKYLFPEMGITQNKLQRINDINFAFYAQNERVFIDAYHPSSFSMSEEMYCDSIIKIAENWYKNIRN